MQTLAIDIETYSDVDLIKCGVYAYANSPHFEILLFAYSVDAGCMGEQQAQLATSHGDVEIIDLANGEELPTEILSALNSPNVIKTAYNAAFERVCLAKYLGTELNPNSWHCTAVQAAELSLPASLADVGTVLGLERQKMLEGKDLIRYFCIPCKPTKSNEHRTRNLPKHAPDKWELFKEYCKRDVEVERQIAEKLKNYTIPKSEHELYVLDQQINDRGVKVDLEFANEAIKMSQLQTVIATDQAYQITGLENPNSVAQIKKWLKEQGVEVDSLSKNTVAELINDTDGDVQEILKLRLLMSKTSVKKYEAVTRSVCSDGRVHGMMRFYGANRTGRWCLAEGTQIVIKDKNGRVYEKPIESVSKTDMVFDGDEWVCHDGVVYSGDKEVITWDGVTATPMHKVFINQDTKITLKEAMERRVSIWRGNNSPYIK